MATFRGGWLLRFCVFQPGVEHISDFDSVARQLARITGPNGIHLHVIPIQHRRPEKFGWMLQRTRARRACLLLRIASFLWRMVPESVAWRTLLHRSGVNRRTQAAAKDVTVCRPCHWMLI
jgi:hypothetical protein